MKKTFLAFTVIFITAICIIFFYADYSCLKYKMPVEILKEAEYKTEASPKGEHAKFMWLKKNDNCVWNSFSVPGIPPNQKSNGYIWVRVKLPYSNYRDPSLLFYTYNQQFEVYIDGKRIYSFGSMDNSKSVILPGSFWHIIELPEEYKGKNVYFQMHSVVKEDTGLVKNFEAGSKANIIMNIVKSGIMPFVLAAISVFIGISIIFAAFIIRRNIKILAYFGISCICTGIWLISEGSIKQMFFTYPKLWEYVKIVFQYMIPVCFSLLINCILSYKFKTFCRMIIWFHTALLIGTLLLNVANVIPIDSTLPIYYGSFQLSMIIFIVLFIKGYSNWNFEVKAILSGIVILCVVGTLDVINWNFNPKRFDIYSTQWGLFIFLMILSAAMAVHFTNTQDKIDAYSEEINSKDKKLFENKQQLEFYSNISHEFRTPLNIILSSIQLIKFLLDDDSIQVKRKDISKYCNSMKQNCFRLMKLVNNLIDSNKIDAGYLMPEFSNNDIVFVVENITQSVADYTKSKGIDIIFDTNVEEKIIAFDPEKIERIMLNLLSNAVKFSKPGSLIKVNIIDENENVVIEVSDTGIGIKQEKLNQIFERFVQADKSFTRDHEGSGIGLSLVKSLVNMHGGIIICESEYGKGSTFKVSLPARLVDGAAQICYTADLNDVHEEKINIEFSDIYS